MLEGGNVMNDLISRQAVIDAINKREWLTQGAKDVLTEVFEQLPSAQPDIIRCKDCRWWNKSEDSPFGYCMAMKHGYMSEHWEIGIYRRYKGDFYCADAERGEPMSDTEMQRIKAICDVAGVEDIGELSDGFHTFNGLYEQRMILFAALVKAYKDKAWKSYRHEDGEWCFGGGWFIVGIDTPEGSYTYHYENKYWDMFDCIDLPRAKHWDGHTEADAETRLMSLAPAVPQWIPLAERLPEPERKSYWICTDTGYQCQCRWTNINNFWVNLTTAWHWHIADPPQYSKVIAWRPLPEPYEPGKE